MLRPFFVIQAKIEFRTGYLAGRDIVDALNNAKHRNNNVDGSESAEIELPCWVQPGCVREGSMRIQRSF